MKGRRRLYGVNLTIPDGGATARYLQFAEDPEHARVLVEQQFRDWTGIEPTVHDVELITPPRCFTPDVDLFGRDMSRAVRWK